MRHVLFAIFDTEQDARNCVQALVALPKVTVVVHRDKIDRNDVQLGETSARAGIITGTLIGATVGGIMGAILSGPIDVIPMAPLTGVLFGLFSGGGAGALGGGLTGAAQPDPVLKEIEQEVKNGKVLVTIQSKSTAEIADIERLCHAHHGRIMHKPVLGFWSHLLRSKPKPV